LPFGGVSRRICSSIQSRTRITHHRHQMKLARNFLYSKKILERERVRSRVRLHVGANFSGFNNISFSCLRI
jgi:hypothetical protein